MSKARIIADYAGTGAATDLATQTELNTVSTVANAALPTTTAASTYAPKASPALTGTATAVNLTVSGDLVPSTPLSHRNMIINGGMQVWQRGTSFTSVTVPAYHLDHFETILDSVGTYTITKDPSAPAGFKNSYKIACTSENASVSAGDAGVIYYKFEGQDVQHLQYNTGTALTTTLRFWIKAKETGNYQVNLVGNNRQISATYTVNVADEWEEKTVTFAGDTGADWASSNNTFGGRFEWWLEGGTNFTGGAVPTSWEAVVATDRNAGQTAQKIGNDTANYWQITGVQWELGSNATPFEHRSYGEELARCQRYYQKSSNTTRMWPIMEDSGSSGYRRGIVWFMQQMRDTPAISGLTFYGGGSTGIQNEGPTSFTPFSNGMLATAESGLTAWTADKEL